LQRREAPLTVQAGLGSLDEAVRDAARTHAFDEYLSALLAPREVRDDLIVLAAFWGETGRVPSTVSEPMLGEIRLQWWRDALLSRAAASGHPVADAMRGTIARRDVPLDLIDSLIDSRETELGNLPFGDEAGFARHLDHADGAFLRISAHVQGADTSLTAEPFLAELAQCLGRVRVARGLARQTALGRTPLWPAAMGDAVSKFDRDADAARIRHAIAILAGGARAARARCLACAPRSRGGIVAALPLALVEPYLRALENERHDPLQELADITPLGRVARLGWMRLSGRL
jgi:phytoene synthase